MLNWSVLGFCSARLEPAKPQQKSAALICQKAGSQVRGRLLIQGGEMPSGICAVRLDGGPGEQLKTIIQLWPLNQEIKMENVQHLLQNSLSLPSTFTTSREVPKLLTDKMNAELLHLYT